MKVSQLSKIRTDMLRIILLFIIGIAAIAGVINIVSGRNVIAVMLPFFLCIAFVLLYHNKERWIQRDFIRLSMLIILNMIYLPINWYNTLGMAGPLSFYVLVIIIISLFFINRKWEIMIPIFAIFESIILYYWELKNPQHHIEGVTEFF